MKKIVAISILFMLFVCCSKGNKPLIGFYFWKTIYKLTPTEKAVLKTNEVQKIYIRYFDIDFNKTIQQAVPVKPICFEEKPTVADVVPVIYIVNKVWLQKNVSPAVLAEKTAGLIQQINLKNGLKIHEIQFDCDWTLATRDRYFEFIKAFEKINNVKITATIRLHQVKYYQQTQLPPVAAGMLMYYNMGKISTSDINSIYDASNANRYVASLRYYPLPVSVAFPIFSWGIHIRDNHVVGLRNKINRIDIEKDTNFVQQKSNWFRAKYSTYKNGVLYQANDYLKTEAISANDLNEMAATVAKNLKQPPKELLFYDLDEKNLQYYEKDLFKKISLSF